MQQGFKPDLMLFDYHLDQGATGVEVAVQLAEHFGISLPVVINAADQSADIRQHALNAGFHFYAQALKEVSLKRLLQRLLNRFRPQTAAGKTGSLPLIPPSYDDGLDTPDVAAGVQAYSPASPPPDCHFAALFPPDNGSQTTTPYPPERHV